MIAVSSRPFLTSNLMFWFLLCTLLISLIAAIFIQPTQFQKSRINVFFSILASVAVLFIGLSVLVSTYIFEKQQRTDQASATKNSIDKLWLYPNQLLATSLSARPEFLKSFYPNNIALYHIPVVDNPQTVHSILEEQNISIVFIQAWEDFLTLRNLELTGDIVWLTNFLQWAQSPYLREDFNFLKYNFKDTTIELAELLFEYAKALPVPTTDANLYHTTAEQMLADKKMIALFAKTTLDNSL